MAFIKGVAVEKKNPCFNWSSREPFLGLIQSVGQLESPEENFSFGTSSFDLLIKANQLGPGFLKIDLLLGFLSWNILKAILNI